MNKIKETKNSVTYRSNRGYTLRIICYYPKQSPEDAVEIIASALEHVGVFDGINPVT